MSEWIKLLSMRVSNQDPNQLEVLNHGIVLFDRERWAKMREQFKEWKTSGVIEQIPLGWWIKKEQRDIRDNG